MNSEDGLYSLDLLRLTKIETSDCSTKGVFSFFCQNSEVLCVFLQLLRFPIIVASFLIFFIIQHFHVVAYRACRT